MSLGNKIASHHMARTLVDAQRALAQKYGPGQEEVARALDDLFGRLSLNMHALILEAALDAWQLGEWARRRDANPEGWRWLWRRMRARQAKRALAASVSK